LKTGSIKPAPSAIAKISEAAHRICMLQCKNDLNLTEYRNVTPSDNVNFHFWTAIPAARQNDYA
jgi:hypothetical protein